MCGLQDWPGYQEDQAMIRNIEFSAHLPSSGKRRRDIH